MTGDTRTALVTGAAGRIGRAVAWRLGRSGFSLVLVDTGADGLAGLVAALAADGLEAIGVSADISTPDGRRACLDAVAAGNLRVLVNNAAMFSDPGIAESDDDHWSRMLAVNLIAPAALIRDAVPLMADGGGSIVNISSVRALASLGVGAAYEASKAGLLAMTRCFAVELRECGIRVNAISPGTIFEGGLAAMGPTLRDVDRIAFEASQPSGDIGLPEQVASVVAFLASDDSELVNGENIVADGGVLGLYAFAAARRVAARVPEG